MRDEHRYDDIINLPHHVSQTRPRMSRLGRAAQFSPFAALTGYDAAITETARLTAYRLELTEEEKAALDRQMQRIVRILPEQPEVIITYFRPDERKDGGAYVTVSGRVKKVDDCERAIVMAEGERISIDEIYGIEELS